VAAAAEVGQAVSKQAHWTLAAGIWPDKICRRTALGVLLLGVAHYAAAASYAVIIAGLGGEPSYEQRFREQASELTKAAEKLTADPSKVISLSAEQATRDAVRRELRGLAGKLRSDDEVMIVLIGHGSFDGEEYRFNLPGPDLTGTELVQLIDALPPRRQLVLNASSASGAVAERWQRDGRVIITATKSGGEKTATRFAQHWVQAVSAPDADVNKDEIVTAAEAFEFAARHVEEGFKTDVSLATEHARLEGKTAGSFVVARFGAASTLTADPQLNAMLGQRTKVESDLDAVKARRTSLEETTYYDELESVLVRLAVLQRQIDARHGVIGTPTTEGLR
jgi:hypothetical protein